MYCFFSLVKFNGDNIFTKVKPFKNNYFKIARLALQLRRVLNILACSNQIEQQLFYFHI